MLAATEPYNGKRLVSRQTHGDCAADPVAIPSTDMGAAHGAKRNNMEGTADGLQTDSGTSKADDTIVQLVRDSTSAIDYCGDRRN